MYRFPILHPSQWSFSRGHGPALRNQEGQLTKKKAPRTPSTMPTTLDQARDELFSHILRCGVLEAAPEHQKEWMDDTMQYLGDRYPDLKPEQLQQGRAR